MFSARSMNRLFSFLVPVLASLWLAGCATAPKVAEIPKEPLTQAPEYVIGPNDQIQIFVWGNEELSATVPVRPDGRITTPLVEDLQAAGKTPTQLARDMEKALATYVKNPIVTVIVTGFSGLYVWLLRLRTGMEALRREVWNR